jgi:hypothetical protein
MDGALERISKCCGRTRRNVTWPQNGLAISQNKTTRTLIELGAIKLVSGGE